MRETSKISLHRVTADRRAGGDRRKGNLSSVFLLRIRVLTMTTMTWTAAAQLAWHRVKRTAGASNVSHALTSPVPTVIQMCCANMKNYHIFSPPYFYKEGVLPTLNISQWTNSPGVIKVCSDFFHVVSREQTLPASNPSGPPAGRI